MNYQLLLFICLFQYSGWIMSQSLLGNTNKAQQYRIGFYNVENFFDASVDTTLVYNEFTPEGNLHWTNRKVVAKRNALYKVITAMGQWNAPTLIGLVEVENKQVLKMLVKETPLNKMGYQFVHFDSPDFRGIDAALIYRADFELIEARRIPIIDPYDTEFATRDMLYVVGSLGADTLHVVVNHWTSRYRGFLESKPKRLLQASILLKLTDSICSKNRAANIIVMGDFNDTPDNESMQLLANHSGYCSITNLPYSISNNQVLGTHKYQSKWAVFDQLLVSQNLLNLTSSLHVSDSIAYIFSPPFVLEADEKYGGIKPYRTNVGYTYHGGYSDHLPVYLDLIQIP